MRLARYHAAGLLVAAALAAPARAQADYDTVTVLVQSVSGNVYMLLGAGGNIGLIVGDDGPVSTRADLQEYRRVVATVRDRIRTMVEQGKSLTEVAAARPGAEFDAKWGRGFINADTFIDGVYRDMVARYRR
jgi:hypothetical protein